MKKIILCVLLGLKLFAQDIIHPSDLRTEYMKNPTGIDKINPQLSWISTSEKNAQIQTAYQIGVSSNSMNLEKNIFDVWDSKKVLSNQSVNVSYNGKVLESDKLYFWKVKVWDKDNKESEWSKLATFSMGLLNKSDWKAKWIGIDKTLGNEQPKAFRSTLSARYLRKESSVEKKVKKATLFVSAAGLYEFHINGKKIGNEVLTPAIGQTQKRIFYNTYDVTNNFNVGKNAFAAVIGPGRWTSFRPYQEASGNWVPANKYTDTVADYKPRYPKLLAQINVEYTDGTKSVIISDSTWKLTADGPIITSNEYDGETYDANKELSGWNSVGYDDSKWMNAKNVSTPSLQISAENKEPIRIMETLKPISIKELKPGVFIADMGQNMVGWLKFNAKGNKGQKLTLRFAEILKPDGSLYLDNMRSAEVTDYYTFKGDANGETWEPKFTYHGFRYVEISGFLGVPKIENFEGKVIHDAVETVGKFSCSNQILTQLHKNAYWGIRGNYRSFPTDCPQRDERYGWLGDRAIETKGEAYIFRNINLYKKWTQDIKDAQAENGSVPDVAPTHQTLVLHNDGVVWPSCYVILPNVMYTQTSDKQIIADNYEAASKWAKYMLSFVQDGLIYKNTYGDWCMPPERLDMIFSEDPKRITSALLLSSCYLYYDLTLLSKYAKILRKNEDTKFWDDNANVIKNAINSKLFNPSTKRYDNNTLSASAIPLGQNIVPFEDRNRVFMNFIEKLNRVHENKMGTGLIGGQWFMKAIANGGRSDLAYQIATETDYPSWGYMINKGATTIWELWNGDKARPDMNSGNHVMLLGDVVNWMYENVGGIASDNEEVGFKKIVLNPDLNERVTWVKCAHNSMYGNIVSEWQTSNNNLEWTIEIPVNTTAKVYIPNNGSSILVNNNSIAFNSSIKFIEISSEKAVFEFPSGRYEIKSKFNYPKFNSLLYSPEFESENLSIDASNYQLKFATTTGVTIKYTLDGTEPNANSSTYISPVSVSKSTTIKAKSYTSNNNESNISMMNLELYNSKTNGWNYQYFEGKFSSLNEINNIKVVKSGVSKGLDIINIRAKEDYYAVKFSSNLVIENDDTYGFYLTSDDGSELIVNGQKIIENDGIHGVSTKKGNIMLKKGVYPVQINYFEGNYGEELRLEYESSTFQKKILPVSKLNLK